MDSNHYAEGALVEGINFFELTEPEKIKVFQQAGNQLGLPPFAIEKDWWVVQTLAAVFAMRGSEYFLFKGGTSLSKAWELIDRFSEDIDIAIDREFFGFPGQLNKGRRDKLKKMFGVYIERTYYPEFKESFENTGFVQCRVELAEEKEKGKDRKINIFYPSVFTSDTYILPRIQIEIGCRSLREPFTIRNIGSLVDKALPDSGFGKLFIKIPSVNPERTFIEKIFLLHEEFHRPPEKMRVDRLSRHLYDIYKISQTEIAELAIADGALFETIAVHRYYFNRISGVDYNLFQPGTLNPIPKPENINAWKNDYEKMRESMIYQQDAPAFDEIISTLTSIKEKIDSQPWRFTTVLPKPNL